MSWILLIVVMLASLYVSWKMKSKFTKYSRQPLSSGMTGREVAEKMLRDNRIHDVQIVSVPGSLTDHYNPAKKTVNLSPEVYNGQSVAAAAVASHECGHAVQHAKAYTWLKMRSALVPAVSIASRWVNWLLLGGIIIMAIVGPQVYHVLLAGVVLFALTTLFSFITLPVEFDASQRALAWLESTRITSNEEHGQAKDALKWAAMTYVVTALGSLATLLYYLSFLTGRD